MLLKTKQTVKILLLQIVLSLVIVAVSCAPAEQEPVPIVKFENEGVNPDGSYQWR